MPTPFDLTDQVAIITGSSRGIGRSIAETMASLGAKVVISSRKAEPCEEVAAGIRKRGGEAFFPIEANSCWIFRGFEFDVTDFDDV